MKTFPALLALLAVACGGDSDRGYDTSVGQPSYRGRPPRILIDQGHHNRHTVRGTYRPFADLLRNDGYAIEVLRGSVTAAALAKADVLVIPSALGTDDTSAAPAFAAGEIDAVEQWVGRGGSLLLVTDHYPFGDAVRGLAARFGVEMHGGMTFDPVHHDRPTGDDSRLDFRRTNGLLGAHPILDGRTPAERVDRVVTFTGQSVRALRGTALLRLSTTAVHRAATPKIARDGRDTRVTVEFGPPASARGWAQAVALPHGRGRVVVLGEAAMITAQRDGGRPIGMNVPGTSNRQFLLNAMHWLTRARHRDRSQ